MSLYVVTISFLFGTILYYLFTPAALFLSILCILFGVSVVLLKDAVSRKYILIFCIALVLGVFRAYVFQSALPEIDTKVLGISKEYNAEIIQEPDVRESVTHYYLLIEELDKKSLVRMTRGHYPELQYGDEIILRGALELPENFTSEDTGKTFDYIHYLEKQHVRYVMAFPQVVEQVSHKDSSLIRRLFEVKHWFVQQLNKKLPPQHAALAGGILLGTKQSLGKELLNAFERVGLIHIVVLSGYNVTLIAEAIQKILKVLPRPVAFVSSLFSIVCFALMTGASATTIRASMMAGIVLLAWFLRKQYGVHRALWLAALLMMLHNPMIALYDPGFQLSFVATLGLLHISPYIENLLAQCKFPNMYESRTILAATIATQIAVAPLLIKMTGELSVISLVANLIVLPIIPIAMLSSFISGILPNMFVSLPFTYISYALLSFVFKITMTLSQVPFAVIKF